MILTIIKAVETQEIMTQHWKKSSIPYFVIVQDQSEVNQQSFTNARRNSSLLQNNSDSHINASNSSSSGNVLSSSKNYYPEIKYVFQDDPEYYDLENVIEENEEAIVLELDSKGEQVESFKSLTPDLQITDVSLKDRDMTKTISINTTRSELKKFDILKPDKNLNYIKQLVDLYRVRSQQLESLL